MDVVLELVGSKTFPFSLRSLKFMGRCVFVGNLDLAKVEVYQFLIFIFILFYFHFCLYLISILIYYFKNTSH